MRYVLSQATLLGLVLGGSALRLAAESPVVPSTASTTTLRTAWMRPADEFPERIAIEQVEPDIRIYVNVPRDCPTGGPTRLILYALPNGNTLEQTVGCRMTPELDWRFDIQHVAAQLRMLRQLMPHESIALICLEAKQHSWPAWRAHHEQANAMLVRLVDWCRAEYGGRATQVTLTGHSGGGSLIWGYIEGSRAIPDVVDRIALLDANYSFDASLHADKLRHWLRRDAAPRESADRRLIVLAYDDRNITWQGKRVVGPDGGTYRATQRMRDAFAADMTEIESSVPPFREDRGFDGRAQFLVHPNPENKILHTALVGEMSGLIHLQTWGTATAGLWSGFATPRGYSPWIQPDPTDQDADSFVLPERPANAMRGKAFIHHIAEMSVENRERAILHEIISGNFPNFLRHFQAVSVTGTDASRSTTTATLEVMPDYLSVGSDDDFVRIPMTPATAQRIADRFGCLLPTRQMVDAIDQQAEIHLAPQPLTDNRESVSTFLQHHELIEDQRKSKPTGTIRLGQLITGIKKDIVISPRVTERPRRLALYGWRQLNGRPIQNLTIVHWAGYVDYSHGVRLVRAWMQVDDHRQSVAACLRDASECQWLSDEGIVDPPRYPAGSIFAPRP